MPALPADIGAAIREAAIAQWSDSGIQAIYPAARDALTDPSAGFFDTLADATTAIAQRGALIGADGRRRFAVTLTGEVYLDPTLGTPTVTLDDAEQSISGSFLVSRIEVDLDAGTTTFEIYG